MTMPTQPQPPIQQMSHWPMIGRLILIAFGTVFAVYVLWWAVLYMMQDKMMFPIDSLPAPQRQPRYPNTLVLGLPLENGASNEAWFVPGYGVNEGSPGPVVMFFHGNAELIDYQDMVVAQYIQRGISVMLVEYRGYGRSGGIPSQENITVDNQQFFDIMLNLPMVDPTQIVFHGRSIGAAIAAQLARTRRPAGLILESAFASGGQMARDLAAPGFLVKNPFNTVKVVRLAKFPILIAHGTEDTLVPPHHAAMLLEAAPDATYVKYAIDHNRFPGVENVADYHHRIDEFLKTLGIDPTLKPVASPQALPAKTAPEPQQPPATAPATTQPQ